MGHPSISGLTVYPVKSARGIPLSLAVIEKRGLSLDRRWMLVDENRLFLSQRRIPRLALISLRIQSESLVAHIPGREGISLPKNPSGELIRVRIWDDEVDAIDLGSDTAGWFAAYLGVQCRLVYMPEQTVRPLKRRVTGGNDQTSFADAYPLLLISEASLDWLNGRLKDPVPMDRFRPNIVVRGCEPFEEDRWRIVRVGHVTLHVVKPCARCVVTTVDQETGLTAEEPLATLSKVRRFGNDVLFGQNCVPHEGGTVHVGDPVEVLEYGRPPS